MMQEAVQVYDMIWAQTKYSRPDFAMSLPSHVDIGADDSSHGQSWTGVDSDDSYYSDPPTSMTRCTIHLFIRLEELFEHTESPADYLAYTMELSERSGHHVLDNIVELLSWALQDREPPLCLMLLCSACGKLKQD